MKKLILLVFCAQSLFLNAARFDLKTQSAAMLRSLPALLDAQVPAQGAISPKIAEKLNYAVVQVFYEEREYNELNPWNLSYTKKSGLGTGFIIEWNGEKKIITNHHVVKSYLSVVHAKKPGSAQLFLMKTEFISKELDLALLSPYDKSFFEHARALSLGEDPRLDEEVIVSGYPNPDIKGSSLTIARGNVLKHVLKDPYIKALEVSAPINAGNSGGPLLDEEGRVTGVVCAVFHDPYLSAEVVTGKALPVSLLKFFLKDIEDGKYDGVPAMSDFHIYPNTDTFKYNGGAYVASVEDGGVMYEAGIREGDIITHIGGFKIDEGLCIKKDGANMPLQQAYCLKQIGETAEFAYLRNGEARSVKVTLKETLNAHDNSKEGEKKNYLVFGGLLFIEYKGTVYMKRALNSPLTPAHYYQYNNAPVLKINGEKIDRIEALTAKFCLLSEGQTEHVLEFDKFPPLRMPFATLKALQSAANEYENIPQEDRDKQKAMLKILKYREEK